MTPEQFIKFIESKGFVLKHGNLYYNGDISIHHYNDEWVMNSGLIELDIDYAILQYPKTEAAATEFFRILGI